MTRKLQLLLTTLLLLLGGADFSWAQSTYTWNISQWGVGTNGSAEVVDGKLVCTPDKYCASVKFTGTFKLPKRQTFIVIKGENLIEAGTDPNIYDFNGNLGNDRLAYFTGNAANTLLYKDITSLLPAETDFFGNTTITSVALYLKKPDGEAKPTISSIDFVAADFIDAMNISSNGNVSSISSEAADGDFKKTLTFTINVDKNDIGLEVSGGTQQLNSSDMFLVIETDNTALNTSSRIKLRSMTAGGTKYDNNSGGCFVANKELTNGHRLYIHSFYKGSETSGELLAEWAENQTMDITKATLYINSNGQNGTTINIYRLGLYNLSEIMQMYNLSEEKWWFVRSVEKQLDVEIHGSATQNWIRINNNYGTENTNTTSYAAQLIRSLGVLPSNFTTIDLNGKLSFVTDVTPSQVDIFNDMPATITEIRLDKAEIINLPTVNPYATLAGEKYFAFKESSVAIPSQIGTSGGNWSSLTRSFKAGYNSLCVPFNKLQVQSLSDGLTVYQLNSYNSSTGEVTFSKVTENVNTNNKNTPYIVHAENAGTYVLLGRDPQTESLPEYNAVSKNGLKFVGTFCNKVPDSDYASTVNYGINSEGTKFLKMIADTKTAYYRAFISVPITPGARELSLSFEDETTGISETMSAKQVFGEGAYFDLSGRRVAQPTKGLYIVNGKKVVIK